MKISQLLQTGKDFANKVQIPNAVPLLGGQKLGDLAMGKAPQEFENWGYGNAPYHVPEMSNIPQLKTGRADPFFDALMMLPFQGPGVGGAEKAAISIIRPKYRDVLGDNVGQLYDHIREVGTPKQRHGTRQMINAVDDPGYLVTSSKPDGGLRGAASFSIDKDKLYLQNIGSTYPGGGTEMMDFIEKVAQKRNLPVTLHSDPAAFGFYEGRGYARTGNYSDSYNPELANPEYIKKFTPLRDIGK